LEQQNLVKSVINGETLIEIKVEGAIELNPEDARMLLGQLTHSVIADQVVVRVGKAANWYKLASRWGAAVRHGVRYFNETVNQKEVK